MLGAGSAPLPCGMEKGQEEVLGVTLLPRLFSRREVGRRGASPPTPLPLAPTVSPCALQETYKLPHRLIEKKRRDRINECIAQLKDLLPEHLKLTVSEKLAALQAGCSAQRAGGGHSPPAGASGNCRAKGWVGARLALIEGTFPQSWGFLAASCK